MFGMKKDLIITDLENKLAEANMDLLALREEVADYKKTISSFPTVKMEYDAQVKKLTEQHTKEMDELKNLLKETESSLNKRVIESLAAIGVNSFAPEEIISGLNEKNPQDAYRVFMSLKGTEQTEYFKQHEKEISKFLSAK